MERTYGTFRNKEFTILKYFCKKYCKNEECDKKLPPEFKKDLKGFDICPSCGQPMRERDDITQTELRKVKVRRSSLSGLEAKEIINSLLSDGYIQKTKKFKNIQCYGVTEEGKKELEAMREHTRWLIPPTKWFI